MRYMATSKYKHFTKSNRNELSILLKKGYSMRDISRVLLKNPSSISREVSNNSVKGVYCPDKAQHKAYVKRKYSKYQGMKILENSSLEKYIQDKLVLGWTPEEISGRLNLENNNQSQISFKSIYKCLGCLTPKEVFFKQQLKFQRNINQFTNLKCCTSG